MQHEVDEIRDSAIDLERVESEERKRPVRD